MSEVRYLQPERLSEVPALLDMLTERSVILAGGTDLLTSIRDKRPEIDTYLSLYRLPELRVVEETGGWLKIGAMVTHTMAAEHPAIREKFSALSRAGARVGSKQIRNKGTVNMLKK